MGYKRFVHATNNSLVVTGSCRCSGDKAWCWSESPKRKRSNSSSSGMDSDDMSCVKGSGGTAPKKYATIAQFFFHVLSFKLCYAKPPKMAKATKRHCTTAIVHAPRLFWRPERFHSSFKQTKKGTERHRRNGYNSANADFSVSFAKTTHHMGADVSACTNNGHSKQRYSCTHRTSSGNTSAQPGHHHPGRSSNFLTHLLVCLDPYTTIS